MSSARDFLMSAIRDSQATLPTEVPGSTTAATVPVHRPHTRKLATIRRIASLEQVNNRWAVAAIGGWKIPVLVDESFKPNELVLFCEVDSFLPHRSPYSKIFEPWGTLQKFDGEEGWRVATQQLVLFRPHLERLKIVSQGRIFPVKNFPTLISELRALRFQATTTDHASFEKFLYSIDFTDKLGIKKWEPSPLSSAFATPLATIAPSAPSALMNASATSIPSSSLGHVQGPSQNPKTPPFIPSTKMERLQNCPNLFINPKYKRYIYEKSVKLDGLAMTVYFVAKDCYLYEQLPLLNSNVLTLYHDNCIFDNGRVGVCSSGRDIVYSAQSFAHFIGTAIGLQLPKLLSKLGMNIGIQGELVGFNILGNPYGYTNPSKKGKGEHGNEKLGNCGNGYDFFVYSIVDLESGKKWNPKAVSEFAAEHGLRHVPIEGYVRVREISSNHDELQAMADATHGEGFVFKCLNDGRWFKVLSTNWLLEKGDGALARCERSRQTTGVYPPMAVADVAHEKPESLEPAASEDPGLSDSANTTSSTPETDPATPTVSITSSIHHEEVPAEVQSVPEVKVTPSPFQEPAQQANQELWDRMAPRAAQFMAWASGNDYQHIIDWVDAWKAKKMADKAFEEATQKREAILAEISNKKQEKEEAKTEEVPQQKVIVGDEIKEETSASGFELKCAAENSDGHISGVDEDPEDDIGTSGASTVVGEVLCTTESVPVRSSSRKTVMISNETVSWLGL